MAGNLFPNNEAIKWFATQGKKGKAPANLSKGFLTSGFFTFRNGWDMNSTVMVVKAGPKGEWHCQPDNGTFDLWFNGKNLFPDSGSYIYAGPGEVQKMRDWFRQTCVHNTLTLDNKNLETTESKTLLWQPDGNQQVLVTQNPSYKNLDLLFNAYHLTGDKKYYDVAVTHALTTMKHHFRKDYTCYHVVSYNNDGTVEKQCTFQGKADESGWARGQAWAVYGYTRCYKETKDKRFLDQAVHVADMIMSRVKTEDCIPYWDYDAPVAKETPRDASAAAVTAAGLFELCEIVPDGKKYSDYAEKILRSLASDEYLAKPGENCGFILKHSTGSLPHGSEIDTPLNYADYYFLEALLKYKNMHK